MGTFVLALHSHLPYCRGAGRWPHGEEWIHEAVLGTYLPLLVLLHDLRDAGVPYRIVIGLTPVLIEQLADQDVDVRSLEYIDDQVRRAQKDIRRFVDAGDPQRAALADFYLGSYRRLRDAYRSRFGRNLVGALAGSRRRGHSELRRAPSHEARVATALAPEASDVDLLRPYYVGASDVVAIARHDRVSGQVWSAFMGYPGDPAYREFHRKDEQS